MHSDPKLKKHRWARFPLRLFDGDIASHFFFVMVTDYDLEFSFR